MQKILILGHKGMLGEAVLKYITSKKYEILTTSLRWHSQEFKEYIKNSGADSIINCIGKIPQHKPTDQEYTSVNKELPVFLDSVGIPVIHPSTDCEFSGNIPEEKEYSVTSTRDASDTYGRSKADVSELIESTFKHTKIIRTSIIGHESNTHVSLLDWFLCTDEKSVRGYTNHYWNGITTLEWAKQAEIIIQDWDNYPVLNQLGSDQHVSKYDMLILIQKIYNKDIEIIPYNTDITVNKCLQSQKKLPSLEQQLIELKNFYNR